MSTPLLSAKLIELRQQSGCSQQEVADCLGVTREAYSHYERNTREPNLEIIVKLAKFYQIEISELINDTTVPIISTVYNPVGAAMGVSAMSLGVAKLSNNINHFLKLFSGKNTTIDFTSVTKEDMNILAQYKVLDSQAQKEVREFIKFKYALNKKKK